MAKYVLCPRCELNYIQEGEEYCDVCKAELKKGPQLVFAVDEDDEQEILELCPKCHQNYLKPGQTLCRQCAKLSQYEEEKNDLDDESWKEYLDDEEPEEEEENRRFCEHTTWLPPQGFKDFFQAKMIADVLWVWARLVA